MGPQTLSVSDILARRAATGGTDRAVIADDGTCDFDGLEMGAARMAAAFAAMGIGPGDRVGLLLPAGLAFAQAFFALARLGAIACPLNTRLSAAELADILALSGMRLLLHHREYSSTAEALKLTCPDLRRQELGALDLLADTAPPVPAHPCQPTDSVLLVFTSGTTGRAKGVLITHDQMLWASLTMVPTLDMRAGDTHLLPVPLFHVGGLSFLLHCVHLGMVLVIPPRWEAETVLTLIESERVAHFFAVPVMLADLLDAPGFALERLQSVRWVMGGGAPVPIALIRRYADLGIPLLQTMGATETCGPGVVVDAANALRKAGSVGRGFFHTELRLRDESGKATKTGVPGEVQLRGRHIASGYWNDPEATRQSFLPDGWFRTGDIGVMDEEGFVTLVDRARNKIITGGENVYPAEVERCLADLPGVQDVAVIGLGDTRWGEIVVAVIVPHGEPPTLERIKAACEGQLARYKHPRKLVLRATLPRNATGKLLRMQLRDDVDQNGS
ncbi:Acyl-CoA synthetase (AMP-forming)/AMP-acid ligase II [Salinihabitans flavidus]|uniref:Acyl-CoA synthetase (AMP-forming)/AMP-acid ligase II n=1 Tax=Salinihabitans flavidus TaxID=569882 RepID=A0A1H8VNA7_9RHOB|nr:AMP-binding protein [Salinihabitans flavidus]SEP16763.1 Acyl-CoA synthetase (AMP-forming)/AMP-acid ligase II [Salinihabitans flavidus]